MGFKKTINSVVENIKENGLKYITPKRIWIFLRSKIRVITGYRLNEKDAILFSEVVTYKALTCPDCAAAGACKKCKCPIPELFVAMDVGCSLGKFPAFEESRNWKAFFKYLFKHEYKKAFSFLKKKRWQDGWKEFKEESNMFLQLFYG